MRIISFLWTPCHLFSGYLSFKCFFCSIYLPGVYTLLQVWVSINFFSFNFVLTLWWRTNSPIVFDFSFCCMKQPLWNPFIGESLTIWEDFSLHRYRLFMNGNWVVRVEIFRWDFYVEIVIFLYFLVSISNFVTNIIVL